MSPKKPAADPCLGGCVLAIVGSRDLKDNLQAEVLIEAALDDHKPVLFVSGGAVGIDTMAESAARKRDIATVVYKPEDFIPEVKVGNVFHDKGLKARNMMIADNCECLLRISSSTTKTYGSGWTADYAERNGKRVQRAVVNVE